MTFSLHGCYSDV